MVPRVSMAVWAAAASASYSGFSSGTQTAFRVAASERVSSSRKSPIGAALGPTPQDCSMPRSRDASSSSALGCSEAQP